MARIFEVNSDGETWWYVADSFPEAEKLWKADTRGNRITHSVVRKEPEDRITIHGKTKTAAEWAKAPIGTRVGSTLY